MNEVSPSLTVIDIMEHLWPNVSRDVLQQLYSMANDESAEAAEFLRGAYNRQESPALSEFLATFCGDGMRGNIRVTLGNRKRVAGINMLGSLSYAFNCMGAAHAEAVLTLLSALYEKATHVEATEFFHGDNLQKHREKHGYQGEYGFDDIARGR
jgi:hypothetical protein